MKIKELVESLGGATLLAAKLGITANAVEKWIPKGVVPLKYWPRLIELSKGKLSPTKLFNAK